MLKIKLARFGKTHQPHYRIVINEAKDKRDGKYVESIGTYAPTQTPKILELDIAAYDAWVVKGAQPTETVAALAERVRGNKPFVKKAKISKKAKARAAAPAAEPEAPVAAVAEAAAPAAEAEAAVAEPTQVEAPVAETNDAETKSEAKAE